jgi:hypothetical protein
VLIQSASLAIVRISEICNARAICAPIAYSAWIAPTASRRPTKYSLCRSWPWEEGG